MSIANMYTHTFLNSKQSVDKALGYVIFENNDKTLWGCADQTASLNSLDEVNLDCPSYLSPGQRSVVYFPACVKSSFLCPRPVLIDWAESTK